MLSESNRPRKGQTGQVRDDQRAQFGSRAALPFPSSAASVLQHQGMASEQPFDDLRIVELGRGVAAPCCAKLFADLGAGVVLVEPPGGSELRGRGPFAGDEPGVERSGLFAYLNTSKLGVTLDVTKPEGGNVFLDLLRDADVLIEDRPPPWTDAAGLSYAKLEPAFPALVMTSITPFGQSGPWRDYQGNDFIAQHASGVAYHNGARAADLEAEPPIPLPGYLGEFAGAFAAAAATMCALFARDASGRGAHVDVALEEVLAMNQQVDVAWVTYGGRVPSRSASAKPPIPYVGQQPAADGYVDIITRTEGQWRTFLNVIGDPGWSQNELFATMASRSQYWDALEPLIQQETRRFGKQELFRRGQAAGVSTAAVNTVADAAAAEHFADRGSFAELEHPVFGRVRCPGPPVRFGAGGWAMRPPPLLGGHNREVLCDRLGYSEERLAALREAGVVSPA
jgi:crotonobetainyl-CoA:carnitine CoA-transferase CaiB-like acyl-CoA transferase